MKLENHFGRETAKENKPFKETKTWISNSYLIRQGCKSGIDFCAG